MAHIRLKLNEKKKTNKTLDRFKFNIEKFKIISKRKNKLFAFIAEI